MKLAELLVQIIDQSLLLIEPKIILHLDGYLRHALGQVLEYLDHASATQSRRVGGLGQLTLNLQKVAEVRIVPEGLVLAETVEEALEGGAPLPYEVNARDRLLL